MLVIAFDLPSVALELVEIKQALVVCCYARQQLVIDLPIRRHQLYPNYNLMNAIYS